MLAEIDFVCCTACLQNNVEIVQFVVTHKASSPIIVPRKPRKIDLEVIKYLAPK